MDRPIYIRSEPVLLRCFRRIFFMLLLDRGFSEDDIVGGLDLTVDQLEDERDRLTIAQHEAFILRMLDLAGDPHFARQVVGRTGPQTDNLSMLMVSNSGQVARALHLFTRYSKIITRVYSLRLIFGGTRN